MIGFILFVVGFLAGLILGSTMATLGWLETFGLGLKEVEDYEEKRRDAKIISELMKNNNVVGKS